jgi:hypothetical protein
MDIKKQMDDLESKIKNAEYRVDAAETDRRKYLKEYAKLESMWMDDKINQQLQTIHYTNGVFVYGNESYVIKRERIVSIVVSKYSDHISITYRPANTSTAQVITIQTTKTNKDATYNNIKKILLGV